MTGRPCAPPARGVPERDILRDPVKRAALVADLNRDLDGTGWHAWEMTDTFRIWASRATGGPGAVPGKPHLTTGCGEAVDEDNPALMRARLEDMRVLKRQPGWLTSAEVADLWRVDRQAVVRWTRGRKFPKGSVRRAHDRTYRFREDVMVALVERAVAEAAA